MVDSNNAINNTVGAKIAGVTNTLTVTNPADNASSAARVSISVGGASAGDSSLNFNVLSLTDFEIGIDNNDDDKLKISASSTLGTNDTFIMTTAGERTLPLQPAFQAIGAGGTNITGDNTPFIIGSSGAWTENFDQGGDFNTNGTFTAPIAGKYFFYASILAENFTAAHTRAFIYFTVNAAILTTYDNINAGAVRDNVDNVGFQASALLDLSASDTVQIVIRVDNGPLVVDMNNGTADNIFFFGYLCV